MSEMGARRAALVLIWGLDPGSWSLSPPPAAERHCLGLQHLGAKEGAERWEPPPAWVPRHILASGEVGPRLELASQPFPGGLLSCRPSCAVRTRELEEQVCPSALPGPPTHEKADPGLSTRWGLECEAQVYEPCSPPACPAYGRECV